MEANSSSLHKEPIAVRPKITECLFKVDNYQKVISLLLFLLVLSIPFGPTLKSVFLITASVMILSLADNRRYIIESIKTPWMISILLLVVYSFLACFFSDATYKEKLLVFEKYFKFFYLPVLMAGFASQKNKESYLQVYLAAMVLISILSIFKFFHILQFNGEDPGRVFHNHIMTGFMVALAFYISLVFAYKKRQLIYLCLAALFSYQVLFVNTGRTGYVIYIFLSALFVLQFFPLRKSLLGFVVIALVSGAVYLGNDAVNTRVNQIAIDLKNYKQHNEDNSISYRLQFHKFAKSLFIEHPIIGNGTGSFTHAFTERKPVPSWDRRLLEPHSNYWLIASEFGMIGLVLFATFILSLMYYFLQLTAMKEIAVATLIAFMLANVTDSFLFYSGTGYLFIVLIALYASRQKTRTVIFGAF